MSTVVIEGEKSVFLTAPMQLVIDERDVAAWASKYIEYNPAFKWIVANYVEADNPNSNGQYWSYEDLRMSRPTINHTPMNINHQDHNIVGTWVGSEMMLPKDEASDINAHIEVVGPFWKYYFPETLQKVEAAYKTGTAFISMECVSETVTCVGDNSCGQSFAYAGHNSPTYCDHIRSGAAAHQMNNPHFLGGALIVGIKPGWKNADIKEISRLTSDDDKQKVIDQVSSMIPDKSPKDWENVMWDLQLRTATAKARNLVEV